MRRMLLVLAIAAVMAAMIVASAMPALAAPQFAIFCDRAGGPIVAEGQGNKPIQLGIPASAPCQHAPF